MREKKKLENDNRHPVLSALYQQRTGAGHDWMTRPHMPRPEHHRRPSVRWTPPGTSGGMTVACRQPAGPGTRMPPVPKLAMTLSHSLQDQSGEVELIQAFRMAIQRHYRKPFFDNVLKGHFHKSFQHIFGQN